MNLNISKNCLKLAKKAIVSTIVTAMVLSVFAPIQLALAIDPLVITSVDITQTDKNATIEWRTNRKTIGKVEYGIQPGDYKWSVSTNLNKDNHAITISGLFPDTKYFIRITAEDDLSLVQSTVQVFETLKAQDNQAPRITNVTVAYLTGNTATIQWETDEDATSEVLYGLTESYGKVKTSSNRKRIHDITLTGLIDATTYQFRVQSKDGDNNTSRWFNMSFRTKFGTALDNDELIIYNISPISENDINVGKNSAVIAWRTNKLAEGYVRYSTSPSPGTRVLTNPPRDYTHNVTLTGLKSGTTYYYDITVKDVFNKTERTKILSFQTKSDDSISSISDTSSQDSFSSGSGIVLGIDNCSISLDSDFGYWGAYYNHSINHPDMNIRAGSPWSIVGRDNDWYDDQYFSFEKIDKILDFNTSAFFGLFNNTLPGDPNHFAINWRAIIDVKQDGNYTYTHASDDDAWIFIDGQLVTNLGGLHKATNKIQNISLSAGFHELEIFYADRRGGNAFFKFIPDSRLKFHPLPGNCSIDDVIAFNSGTGGNDGIVLGSSNEDDLGFDPFVLNDGPVVQPTYACNPDLGYTKIKALYKTNASPDVWALLETGQKHYITSPESFNLYQCNWSRVQTVSESFLNSLTNATLVRTPTESTIYHLFDRPIVKWLKINIPSPTLFVSYEDNFWGNVARVNHLDLASYPDVKLITGENDDTAYLIEGNTKRPFSSPSVFTAKGYDWIEIVTLNQPHLDSYVTGSAID